MVQCAVPSCKNDSRKQNKKNSDISFHRFPKSHELANKWVIAIKRPNWEPNIRSAVCSNHFGPASFFETKAGLRRLAGGAIPELKLKDEAKQDSEESSMEEEMVVPSMSKPLPNPTTNDTVMPSASQSIVEPCTDNDTPCERRLKRKIIYLHEIAKRRRLRCNALYTQRNRMKKKIASLTGMLKQLREKQATKTNTCEECQGAHVSKE